MPDMKTLRTLGIIVAVALAAFALAVLPSVDEAPAARSGITVGAPAEGGSAEQAAVAESDGATHDGSGSDGGDGPAPGSAGESVAIPQPSATEQPVHGIHSDTGVGSMNPEASPKPAPAPAPAPKPAPQPAPSAPRTSGGSSSSGSSSSSGGAKSTPPRPSGVCEWDDGELECDDDGDDDDGDDDDDDDD